MQPLLFEESWHSPTTPGLMWCAGMIGMRTLTDIKVVSAKTSLEHNIDYQESKVLVKLIGK